MRRSGDHRASSWAGTTIATRPTRVVTSGRCAGRRLAEAPRRRGPAGTGRARRRRRPPRRARLSRPRAARAEGALRGRRARSPRFPALEPPRDERRLRILVVSAQFPYPPRSGFEMRVYQLTRQLATRHDVTLLSYADADECTDASRASRELAVEVVARDGRPVAREKRATQALSAVCTARRSPAARCTRARCRRRSTGSARAPLRRRPARVEPALHLPLPGRHAARARRAQRRVRGLPAHAGGRAVAAPPGLYHRLEHRALPPLRAGLVAPRRRPAS